MKSNARESGIAANSCQCNMPVAFVFALQTQPRILHMAPQIHMDWREYHAKTASARDVPGLVPFDVLA